MKYLKIITFTFLVSCFFSAFNTSAYVEGMQSLVGIELPKWGKDVVAYSSLRKELDSPQYYYSAGAVDQLTGAIVNIKVKTKSELGTTSYILVKQNETKSWGTNVINIFGNENYDLIMRREKSAITVASHSGTWYIDDRHV